MRGLQPSDAMYGCTLPVRTHSFVAAAVLPRPDRDCCNLQGHA